MAEEERSREDKKGGGGEMMEVMEVTDKKAGDISFSPNPKEH